MTRSARVLMIGRHFWPHGSIDAAGALLQLAAALQRKGVHVEVLAPQFASTWPESIQVREIPVHRAVAAPRSDWGMGKYIRGLTGWLQLHAGSFDLLFLDSIREETLAVMDAAHQLGIKTILRCRGWGGHSDCIWWESSRFARRCMAAARRADAVIASSAAVQRTLLIHGFSEQQIKRIAPGFPAIPSPTLQDRRDARRALATANGDLFVERDAPVVLCHARMVREHGLELLVHAAQSLVTRFPNLRIWFIGDGPYRDAMYQQLKSDGVRASIAMPGSFADPEDLFTAADVYVQCDDDGLDYFLPAAISHELPIVVLDRPLLRSVIETRLALSHVSLSKSYLTHDDSLQSKLDGGEAGLDWSDSIQWCEGETSRGVRLGISRVLDQLDMSRQLAKTLRRTLVRHHPLDRTTDAYLALIARLIPWSPPPSRSQQTEVAS